MPHQLGEIFCMRLERHSKKKQYVMIVGKSKNTETSYILIPLVKAKPYEYDSIICVRWLAQKRKEQISKVSGIPFFMKDLSSCGNLVGKLGKSKLTSLLEFMDNRNAYKSEKARLRLIGSELHERYKILKKEILICSINAVNYSSIEKEKDEIARKLGYKLGSCASRERFRIAPSKNIKIFSGGRGG